MTQFYNSIKNLLRPWKNPIDYSLLLTIKIWGAGKILSGPFKGLKMKQKFPTKPMLLGVWEKELSFIWDSLNKMNYILDVGAAEGFYAVGLARKYPNKKVLAFEMDPSSKNLLERAAKNNATANLETYGKCEYVDLLKNSEKLEGSLVIMDCEGYEVKLLEVKNPSIFKKTHILVELHEMYEIGCTEILKNRFASSHQISEIKGQPRKIEDWPHQLRLLTLFFPKKTLLHFMDEGRPYPMNWLYMKPNLP
jgi:hypothetical protein